MSLIHHVRKKVIQKLFANYSVCTPHIQKIIRYFDQMNFPIILDHFAIIDLPNEKSNKTGISVLNQIFSSLNYIPQGRDYLSDKQNEFMWIAPAEAEWQLASEADPQIVLADFNLDDLDPKTRTIILQYTSSIPDFPWRLFHRLCGQTYHNDEYAAQQLIELILHHCQQRIWSLPSLSDYLAVKESNELLAWVLAFGREVSHFAINIGLLNHFKTLEEFNQLIQNQLHISLNQKGGIIKGNAAKNIAQSGTEGEIISITLAHHEKTTISSPFMEFIWRANVVQNPCYWKDYFTGFIGPQADYVIESVYDESISHTY